MEPLSDRLFTEYLSRQTVARTEAYTSLSKSALALEKNLRRTMTSEQTAILEALFETTSQLHFLEVKDSFQAGWREGAAVWRELIT